MFMFLYNSLWVMFNMKYLNSAIFNMGIKFILLIALLVFVRGGIPRYRFDFLTKIGWIKFLSLILSIFLSSMLLIFLF
jgi:NADH:ubiquinone oxidoreductase subunit H